jgi:hypothetical protein
MPVQPPALPQSPRLSRRGVWLETCCDTGGDTRSTLQRRYAIGRASIWHAINAGDRGYLRFALDGHTARRLRTACLYPA